MLVHISTIQNTSIILPFANIKWVPYLFLWIWDVVWRIEIVILVTILLLLLMVLLSSNCLVSCLTILVFMKMWFLICNTFCFLLVLSVNTSVEQSTADLPAINFLITSEGLAILDALRIISRSLYNCRLFGYYGGVQKLTALMKGIIDDIRL